MRPHDDSANTGKGPEKSSAMRPFARKKGLHSAPTQKIQAWSALHPAKASRPATVRHAERAPAPVLYRTSPQYVTHNIHPQLTNCDAAPPQRLSAASTLTTRNRHFRMASHQTCTCARADPLLWRLRECLVGPLAMPAVGSATRCAATQTMMRSLAIADVACLALGAPPPTIATCTARGCGCAYHDRCV